MTMPNDTFDDVPNGDDPLNGLHAWARALQAENRALLAEIAELRSDLIEAHAQAQASIRVGTTTLRYLRILADTPTLWRSAQSLHKEALRRYWDYDRKAPHHDGMAQLLERGLVEKDLREYLITPAGLDWLQTVDA